MATTLKRGVRVKLGKAVAAANRGDCDTARSNMRIASAYSKRMKASTLKWQREDYREILPSLRLVRERVKAKCPR